MKNHIKALAGIISILLLATSISVGGYSVSAQNAVSGTTLPWTDEYIAENFNSAYDVNNEKGLFTAYGGVKRNNFEITDGRLKGTYPAGSGENDNGYVWTTKIPSPEKSDIGVKFDIDASEVSSELRFRILLSVEGVGYLQPSAGTVVYLVSDSGDVTTAKVDNISTFKAPTGFKGSAAVYFNALFDGNNDKLDNEKLFEQSQLTFQLRTFDVTVADTVIYFDNVAYISNTGLNYNGRIINALSNFSVDNIGAWRDGGGDPIYNSSTSIAVSESGVKASYPVLSGNRMFANFKLWEKGALKATDMAVSVDIDASEFKTTSPKLQIRLNREGANDYSLIADGARIDLINADTEEVIRVKASDYGNSKGSYINIPVGFKGTVLVELSDLTSSSSTSVYDYAKMTVGCVVIDNNEEAGIVYSNIRYYSEKTELPWSYSRIAYKFSSDSKPTCWGGGSDVTFKTAENLNLAGGNLEVTYPKVSGNEMTWELKTGTAMLPESEYKAIGMDIDASGLTYSPRLQLQLRQEGGSYYRPATGAKVYFVDENGIIATVDTVAYSSKGAYVSVPVGFKGTAVFGLADFTDTNATDSDVYAITNLTVRTLIIDTNEESVITYDNIRYIGTSVEAQALVNVAGLWFGADDTAVRTDGVPGWLSGKLAVTSPSNCIATSSGYVYALDGSDSVEDAEVISRLYMQGSSYKLVRKSVKVGETVSMGTAAIICGNKVYFGNTSPIRFGDCDSNKKTDIRDLIRLKKYLSAPDSTTIYVKAAKTDLETAEIGTGDLVMLRKYLIGSIDKLGY